MDLNVLTNDFLNSWTNCGTIFSKDRHILILGWGKRTRQEKVHAHLPSFYFPDFFLKDISPWFTHEFYTEISISQLRDFLAEIPVNNSQKIEWNNPHQTLFNTAFAELQKKFKNNELNKAVPFATESAESNMHTSRLVNSLKAILEYAQNNSVYVYGFWDENEGMLGATPEKLFSCNDQGLLETMACAGTKKMGEDENSLLSDPKELHEHDLVVQGIRQSLTTYGKVTAGPLQLLKLPHLMHLVTPLSMQLQNQLPFQELVNALHPTPALGAYPKDAGMKWLLDYQQHIDRSRFGAPAGYFLPETMQSNCYVAIRNVQWKDAQMHVSAGCGVVAKSQCDREWNEINLKLNAIKKMLDL